MDPAQAGLKPDGLEASRLSDADCMGTNDKFAAVRAPISQDFGSIDLDPVTRGDRIGCPPYVSQATSDSPLRQASVPSPPSSSSVPSSPSRTSSLI